MGRGGYDVVVDFLNKQIIYIFLIILRWTVIFFKRTTLGQLRWNQALQSGLSWFYTIFVCSPFYTPVRFLVGLWLQSGWGSSVLSRQHDHRPAVWFMTGPSEDMEKQARLLSAHLVLGDRLVEVAATRTVLAWKGIKKDKKSSEIISFSKTGQYSKTWRRNCSNSIMFNAWGNYNFYKQKTWFKKKIQFPLH